jgi:hypothetical protein
MFSLRKIILLTVSIISANVFAQERPTYDFLKVDPNARASALGGAFETYTDDPNVMFYNPAGLSTMTKKQVSAGFGKYLLDINYGTVSYGMKYKNAGWLGVGIKYFNYGTFDYADENGATGGTFGANDFMLSLTYSNYVYEKINYGVSIKYIYSKIDKYNSSGLGIDFGFLYVIPWQELNLALSINNFGLQLDKYDQTTEKLPLDVRFGISKKLEHLPVRLSFSLSNLNQEQDKFIQRFKAFAIGGEFAFSESFTLRIGYSNEKRQDLKVGTSIGIAGFSAGFGFKVMDKYKFDYAFNSLGKVGSTHKFNLAYVFKE